LVPCCLCWRLVQRLLLRLPPLGGGGERLVVHPRQELHPVAGGDALAPVERAEPPSLQALCVLFQDSHDVALPEAQLVGSLGDVVIQRLGKDIL